MVAVSWDGGFQYAETECASKNHRLILTQRVKAEDGEGLHTFTFCVQTGSGH
jgi:hypothetical protein